MIKRRLPAILLLLLALAWGSFVQVPPVYAATITVTTEADVVANDGQCSLREAIQNANDDAATHPNCDPGSGADTINFSGAVSTITLTSEIFLNTEIIMDGQSAVTISGGGTTHMFVVSNNGVVTMQRLTFTNGYNAGSGGAIRVDNLGSLTVEQSNFNNNNADTNGGAINSNGTLSIDNTLFTDNTAGTDGGAIWQSSSSTMTISESAFSGNTAGNTSNGKGGAVYHNGQILPSAITATYFSNNRALNIDATGSGGGAIFHNNGILAITASAFSGNNADGDFARGGAVYNASTTAGAMAINYSHFGETLSLTIPSFLTISITDPNTVTNAVSNIDPNQQGGGGAIYSFGPILVNSSSFIGNTSSNNGGAFNGRGTSSSLPIPELNRVIIANSTFVNNSATNNGGAIYNDRTDDLLEVINSTIANNSAASGGGIYNRGDGESPDISNFDDVHVTNTILSNNSGGNCAGGALGNGNLSASGNNVIASGACDIRQQDGSSSAATPITASPNLGTEQLALSLPNILTIVMPLNAGSSALGAGDAVVCAAFPILNLDQRGPVGIRPQGDPNCDSGAFESPLLAPTPEINVQGNSVDIASGDATPDLADHTDFGTTLTGSAFSRTFTIQNTGTGDLSITLPVSVPAGFTVTTDPATTVAASGNTTFVVRCDATTNGTYSGNVSITNNDSDENPYTFAITCQVNDPAPEINVQGNGVDIANGDNIPDLADHTFFGPISAGSPISHTFTIQNIGTANLNITAAVTVPAGFTVTADPATPVAASGSTTFTVQCDATTDGSYSGDVSISNNDADENPYTFAIFCHVAPAPSQEINVQGNGVDIASGDASPSLADHTDFGATTVGAPISRTFTIQNIGSLEVGITLPVSVPAGFTVTLQPAATVTAGNNTTFTVQCDATTDGVYSGNVSISNDDADENPYTFAITCEVTAAPAPEINVQGNGVDIASGDATPSLADHTDFGATTVGSAISRTFTIQNIGTGDLTITAAVTAPAGFTVTLQPAATVTAGNNSTFTVQCNAATDGTFSGNISIANDDADENPYTFAITCDVTAAPVPEINVQGNGVDIASGDATPSLADHTDFGSTTVGSAISRTFTIQNIGTGDLSVTLPVTVPAGFTVTADPATTVAGSTSTTFTVQCDATTDGVYSGNVSITNNDSDENPYTFAITCDVTAAPVPEINVQGNSVDIASGDATPALADHTDFGSTTIGAAISRTFTIQNIGTGDLSVTLPVTVPAGFTVMADPATTVAGSTSTTFTVQCDATTDGVYSGNVSITNNDSDENPYTFAITCEVTAAPAPEINVQGNGVDIASGDATPSLADHTDFGSTTVGAAISRTFTIQNIGTGDLSVTLPVTVPAGFTVTADPATTVAGSTSTTFTVQCDATTDGTYSGNISISNNDTDENPYTFSIVCDVLAAVAPEINLQGNGVSIISGDATPDLADHTDFGSTTVGAAISRTFTIQNIGTADLTITAAVTVPAGFTVTTDPATTIGSSSSTTFTVQCDATTDGAYSGNVSITNNDSDENPYTFAITCEVTAAPAPEINVQGNSVDIASGDATPALADHTDFGSTTVGAAISRTFTVQNLGTADLTITAAVTAPAGFSVTLQPAATVTAGNNTTFTVQCDATTDGVYSGNVSITNNDSDENPYTFAITCEVTAAPAPEINLQGNGVDIASGDATPALADHTDFDSTTIGTAISRTFTVQNIGTADLTITAAVTAPAGFSITLQPAATVTTGNSTTFTVQCDATTDGVYSGNISIANDDANENPYTFAITCAVNPPGSPTATPTAAPDPSTGSSTTGDPRLILRGIGISTNAQSATLFNQVVEWQFSIENASGTTYNNVIARVTFPADDMEGISAGSSRGVNGVFSRGSLLTDFNLGTINPGEIITLTIETRLPNRGGVFDGTLTVNVSTDSATLSLASATQLPSTGESPWWREWALAFVIISAGFFMLMGVRRARRA